MNDVRDRGIERCGYLRKMSNDAVEERGLLVDGHERRHLFSDSESEHAGIKHDSGKPAYDLLPPHALDAIARVLAHGATKYSPGNWRRVDNRRARYTAAALRHVFAWMRGEVRDAESGEHHLAHAGCCLLFLLDEEESPAR